MNTKHIPPFSFPKPAKTVFVMTLCEEISGISPIPKILDCRSHLFQAQPYLSPVGVPRDGLLDFPQPKAQLKDPTPALSRKKIQSYQNTGRLYIHTLVLDLRGKNVHFKIEWHFSHQPDCSAFLHYHVKSATGFFTGKQIALNKDHACLRFFWDGILLVFCLFVCFPLNIFRFIGNHIALV